MTETSEESTVNTLLVKSAASEIKEGILNVKMLSTCIAITVERTLKNKMRLVTEIGRNHSKTTGGQDVTGEISSDHNRT